MHYSFYCDDCHTFYPSAATAPVAVVGSGMVSGTAVRISVVQCQAVSVAVGGCLGHAEFCDSIVHGQDKPQEHTL